MMRSVLLGGAELPTHAEVTKDTGHLLVAPEEYPLAHRMPAADVEPRVHDREVEAAMTGAFFFGPVAAVMVFAVGLRLGRHSNPRGR